MRLLLVRHGNTFGPGDKVVWVGAGEDYPLVTSGEAQAKDLGTALAARGVQIDAAVTGPLIRTRRHAELVLNALGQGDVTPTIDDRLREIDYGPWGGLTDQEIADQFGDQAARELAAWQTESQWPVETVTWRPGEDALKANVRDVATSLSSAFEGQTVLLCSSNGVLRYFLELTEGGLAKAIADGTAKMKTGAASVLDVGTGRASVVFWNKRAEDLPDWS